MTVEELTRSQELAVRRWKGGHHAFHVLLVAMNTRLDQAAELLDAGRRRGAGDRRPWLTRCRPSGASRW